MKTSTIIILLFLSVMVIGCTRTPLITIDPVEEPNPGPQTPEQPITPIVEPQSNPEIVVEPTMSACPSEIHTSNNIYSEGSSKGEGYSFTHDGIIYSFTNQGEGKIYLNIMENRTKDFIDTITIPAGVYAPKNAIKINGLFAVKVVDRTYERIDKIYAKEKVALEIYNLSADCKAPEFETRPIVALTCSGGAGGYGDCVGTKYGNYMIGISAWNDKDYKKFDLSLSIDGGDKLLPFSESESIEDNGYVSYQFPHGTFSQGSHILTVELDTDDGVIFKENYKMLILPDDKIIFRPYQRADLCYDDEPDFVRYYDITADGILVKHNFYPNKLSLSEGRCVTSQTGFTMCDNGEKFSGSYEYKILALKDAKTNCGVQALNLPDSCKTTETIGIGDSFTDRYGQEYSLVKIYDYPKLVAFRYEKKDWIVYYPYDVSYEYTDPVAIQSVNGNSVTILHTDVFCDIQR